MNYYNDHEPYVAQWLRNLIKGGIIPAGDVDCRPIQEVTANDVRGYTQCHFFAGIGGWSEALRLAGWPTDRSVWTGSCPCQPFSCAGEKRGVDDERHLWPEFRRLISECGPTVVFGEQVASKDGREWLTGVRLDLETLGYAVGASDLCAASVAAPHPRQRLWWVADANGAECDGRTESGGERRGRILHASDRSGNGRLADTEYNAGRTNEPGRETEKRIVDRRDCCGGMEDSDEGRRRSWGDEFEGQQRTPALVESGGACGMGDADSTRREELCGAVAVGAEQLAAQCPGGGFWSDSIFIPFGDGKARRLKPGLATLVDGIPGRVGQICAYGNAINPYVAAEFILAYGV
jgi:DNA (cytosine-5)-methyltransferase 1